MASVKKIILFCVVILALSTVSCAERKSSVEIIQLDKIAFYDAVPEEYARRGYCAWTETDNARYYFAYGTDEEKTQLVRNAELIIQTANGQYQMQPMLPSSKITISFRQDSMRYEGNGPATGVEINPKDRNQIGVLTYFLSGGRLPAWLCVGLEQLWLYEYGVFGTEIDKDLDLSKWYQEAKQKGLPALGDEWFIPGIIEDDLADDVQTVSYAFVRYIKQENQLAEMVEAYLDIQKQWGAEAVRNRLWSECTNTEETEYNAYVYFYMMNQYMYSPFQESILFCLKGKHGNYFYSEADWWTMDKAIEYADTGESSIEYVKNWFGDKQEEVINVHYIANDGKPCISGQWSAGGQIRIRSTEYLKPIGIAHEVVHVMLDLCNLYTKGFDEGGYNFEISRYCLEEGICDYINYSFIMETDNPLVAVNAQEYCQLYIKTFLGEEYLELFQLKWDDEEQKSNAVLLADLIGLKDMENYEMTGRAAATGENIQYLLGAGSITSFVFYLFEVNDNKEGFLEVYKDAARIEEVYEKDLDNLIRDWLACLKQNYA